MHVSYNTARLATTISTPDKVDTLYVNDTFTRSIETIYLHGDTIRAFRNIIQRNDTIYTELAQPAPADTLAAADIQPVDAGAVADSIKASDNAASSSATPFKVEEVSDTIRYVVAAPHVKFYRKDMQGLCDSLTYVSADTMVHMNYNPIVWSDNRQISGDVIQIHLREAVTYDADSVAKSRMMLDRAYIPSAGFMAELIEDGYYNQLSGKEMIAQFTEGALSHLDVNGNVLAINFPEENDSTINKVWNIESSFLAADFKDNAISHLNYGRKPAVREHHSILPKNRSFFLPTFKWYGEHRPLNPDDIFDFPDSLQAIFDAARSRGRSSAKTASPLLPSPASQSTPLMAPEAIMHKETTQE